MFSSLRLAALIFVFFTSYVYGLAIPLVKRDSQQLCNGNAGLCGRSYGNVTQLGAHDSFAASGFPWAIARTQERDVDAQLMMGVRLLQAQSHMKGKHLHFCHTSCFLFDGGLVKDYFTKVKHFLDRHPNEIITLILTNPEHVSLTEVWQPIFESTGLANMSYVPPKPVMARNDWPTLKELLDAGTRVVVFMDKGAEDRSVSYILPQFEMMWEDEFDPTNPKFPSKVDRTSGSLPPSQQLSLINQNLNVDIFGIKIPDRLDSPRTNSINSILNHAEHSALLAEGNRPNFVLVDFVNVGQAAEAVARLNGFQY